MSADLKPCPFCGFGSPYAFTETTYMGEVTWADGLGSPGPLYSTRRGVVCGVKGHPWAGCGALIYGESEEDAAMKWNRRA